MFELKKIEAEWRARMHKALSFDGVDDYVEVPASDIFDFTSELCAVVWVYGRKGGRNQMLLHQQSWGAPQRGWFLQWDNGNNVTCFQLTNPVSSPKPCISRPSLSEWHMIAYNWGRPTLHMIVNGKIVDEYTWDYDLYTAKDLPIYIGVEKTAGYFDGLIAQVLIYNRALSSSEIKYLYHNPFDPIDPEHLVLWLNPAGIDVANSKWWDLSGKGNHGTIYGATEVKLVEEEIEIR